VTVTLPNISQVECRSIVKRSINVHAERCLVTR
jgi:hypothetical protein